MQLGMTLAEYEASVAPKNKMYHELAEARYLQRQRIIPYDDEEGDGGGATVKDPSKTQVRGSSEDGFRNRSI